MITTIFPINDFLYLLQLEEYDSTRYAKLLPRFFFRRHLQVRDTLKNTQRINQMRAVSIFLLAIVCTLLTTIIIQRSQISDLRSQITILGAVFSLLLVLTPLTVLAVNMICNPYYELLKRNKEKKAAAIIRQHPELKIIAITGSYGKTTTKTALVEFLKNDYRIQFTPGNINTPTGIAQWILDKFQPNTLVLIIEMDAYQRGEIARSCAITPPNISLITNFGDQHLERFGSPENLTLAYLEAFTHAAPSARLLISQEEYRKTLQYQSTRQLINNLTIQQYNNTAASAVDINIKNAKVIAEQLGISSEAINIALPKIQPPDRRGDIKTIDGYTVIDRSYNISESTAKQGVLEAHALATKPTSQQASKQLVVITAGIPERGEESEKVNKQYGQFLRDYAHYIIVLQSIYAPAIESGIDDPSKIQKATRIHEALTKAKSLGTPEQILILMQPELTDLSY